MKQKGIKRVEMVRQCQIMAVFCGSIQGDFLPVQVIYKGKLQDSKPLAAAIAIPAVTGTPSSLILFRYNCSFLSNLSPSSSVQPRFFSGSELTTADLPVLACCFLNFSL